MDPRKMGAMGQGGMNKMMQQNMSKMMNNPQALKKLGGLGMRWLAFLCSFFLSLIAPSNGQSWGFFFYFQRQFAKHAGDDEDDAIR
jgi:hypothetical protein